MPRRRDEQARVLGPTWCEDKQAWRVTIVDPSRDGGGSGRHYRYFGGEEDEGERQALKFKGVQERRLARLEGTTISGALDDFEVHLADSNNANSLTEKMRRLRLFFAAVADMQLARLQPPRAAELYAAFRPGRRPDYHRNTLGGAKGFLDWCVRRGTVATNALAGVEGVGKRTAGKPQLTGDEAQRLYGWLLWKASRRTNESERRDSDAALGLMLCLVLALRQGDVIKRAVRDVDLDATVLRISGGKTPKSNRPRTVPAPLQPLLRQLVTGRSPLAPLFVALDGGHHTKSWLHAAMRRFCRDAGVPVVCPHALKGTVGTVLAEDGETAEKIAAYLSHEHQSTTQRHYIAPGAVADAQAARGFALISGGRR